MDTKNKQCVVCGEWFTPRTNLGEKQLCCSKDCSNEWAKKYSRLKNKERSTVGKLTTCKICGREYIKEYSMHVYCSDECKTIGFEQNIQKAKEKATAKHDGRERSRKKRGSQEYERECIVCGKTFKTWLPQKKTCSEKCKTLNANAVKRERDRIRQRHRVRSPEENRMRYIKKRYGTKEAYQAYLAEVDRMKRETKQKKEAEKEANHRFGECVVCGKSFETYNPRQVTCGSSCSKKRQYARKHKRIPKEQMIDNDITLEALYRRDSGFCYLCGRKCDWNDKDGNIVGADYPSIDHLIPVARGGLHAWNNVRLAHFKCNTLKSDTIIPSVKKMIPANAYQFKQNKTEQKKRTAQYALNGQIVAVFPSTAAAERETGFKQRGIQNCARGETKTYGGFVWRYE